MAGAAQLTRVTLWTAVKQTRSEEGRSIVMRVATEDGKRQKEDELISARDLKLTLHVI